MSKTIKTNPRIYVTESQFAELQQLMLDDAIGLHRLTSTQAQGLISRGILAGKAFDIPFPLVGTTLCPEIEVIRGEPSSDD